MTDPPSSPAVLVPNNNNNNTNNSNDNNNNSNNGSSNSQQPEPGNKTPLPDPPVAAPPSQYQTLTPPIPNPNPNPSPTVLAPGAIPSYSVPPMSAQAAPPGAPSFRPVPQFSPIPNFQNPNMGVQPPGVSAAPGPPPQLMAYQVPPGQVVNPALRPYVPGMPNGYAPPTGMPRYPYPPMVRPMFTPRPPGVLGVPQAARPLTPVLPGGRPLFPPFVRPVLPSITPAEKPQTTVYVGKIAPTVENDFMLSLLRFCGPVKSWKRAQDPTDGTPRGFGFCEFESAEGVLRALRLLSKFNIDGQELVLNVNQATREYLERYVQKKTENSNNLKETQATGTNKEDGNAPSTEKDEPSKSSGDGSNSNDNPENDSDKGIKESTDAASFGLVTEEDKEADREALEKLSAMLEERLKSRPLPPPPPQAPADGSGNSNSELPSKSRDGDSDVDAMRTDAIEGKNDDETTSDNKAGSEHDKPETSSPDKNRRYDRRTRDRDRDRNLKRDKDRELERYERETERERVRKEREQRRKIEDSEREYEERLKDWEYREREKDKQRQYEKEREKERERKRKKEILHEEEEDDDLRKRWRKSALEDKRRKRLREKEEDMTDRLKEQKEIVDAQRRVEEERLQQQHRDALQISPEHVMNGDEKTVFAEEDRIEGNDMVVELNYEVNSGNENQSGDGILQNGTGEEPMVPMEEAEARQSANAPMRKLGFGLVGSGKRTAVPSVFYEEEDDEANKDKKMRPLVPIDYSTEELQAVQPPISGAQPPNLVAAAEFAKRLSNVAPKDEKPDVERERSRRPYDRTSQRERDRNEEDNRSRDENRERVPARDRDREHGLDKVRTPDKQKLLDAKQLIDMIPKTKDELFLYEINWAVYDKHELHERMRPWISKKITEFLGEEETTLVDYIVTSTQEHVKASQMLEMLQSILDDEAEMFVLKMWRMLIFEIKKVETGLSRTKKRDDGSF